MRQCRVCLASLSLHCQRWSPQSNLIGKNTAMLHDLVAIPGFHVLQMNMIVLA